MEKQEKGLYKRMYETYLNWKLEKVNLEIDKTKESIADRTEFALNCFCFGYRDTRGLAKLYRLEAKKKILESKLD